MSNSDVTITLGSYGQVVRRTTTSRFLNGRKRFRGESNRSERFDASKRLRGDSIRWNSSSDGIDGRGGERNDLRLKLIQKGISKLRRVDASDARWKWDPHKKFSMVTRPHSIVSKMQHRPEVTGRRLLRRLPGSETTDCLPSEKSSRKLYPHKAAMPETAMLIQRNASTSDMMQRSSQNEEHLTVASLLDSLGLEKYAITFRAEEVDMTALKQMGDKDLKEIGIPMGPRKKILIAIKRAPSKYCPP